MQVAPASAACPDMTVCAALILQHCFLPRLPHLFTVQTPATASATHLQQTHHRSLIACNLHTAVSCPACVDFFSGMKHVSCTCTTEPDPHCSPVQGLPAGAAPASGCAVADSASSTNAMLCSPSSQPPPQSVTTNLMHSDLAPLTGLVNTEFSTTPAAAVASSTLRTPCFPTAPSQVQCAQLSARLSTTNRRIRSPSASPSAHASMPHY